MSVFAYTLPLFVSALFTVWLALLGWRRRLVPGAAAFAVMMACCAWWQLTYALELTSDGVAAKRLWVNLEYLGIVTVPVAWLLCALQISGQRLRRSGLWTTMLLMVPLATVLLKWTDDQHGLVWSGFTEQQVGPLDILLPTYGAWFLVHSAYSFAAIIVGTVLLLRFALRAPRLYRMQVSALIAGTIAPWIGIVVYLTRVVPLDSTPYTFTVTGALFMYSLFRYRLFDLMPVARDTLVESMQDGVLVLDERQRVVDLNRAACTILATGNSDAVGGHAGQLPALAGLQYDERETEQRLLVGQGSDERYIDVTVTPLRSGREHLSGHLLVLRDVTRRVDMERAVRESEARYRAVSELTSDYTFSFAADDQGVLQFDWVTDSFTAITGYVPDELVPLGGWSALFHPDDRPAALDFAKRLVKGEDIVQDLRIVTKNGDVRWLRNYARPEAIDGAGRVTRVVGASRDITERRHAETELALARDQALEAARLKSEFFAIMSHELRTPLNAIIGFTELTLNTSIGPINEQQSSALQRVSRNAHQLLDLINGILDISKLDADGVRLANEEVRIADVVQSAVYNVEALAVAKRLHLQVDRPAPDVPLLIGDAGRLHQIVLNLLSNAIKFSPEDGIVEVTTEFGPAGLLHAPHPAGGAPEGDWFVISVCDTGIGIPAEEHERIWTEFYQVDGSPTRRFGGTGLGLAIVRRLAQRMGGHVALRSDLGQGSTFSVWLPSTPVEAPSAA